MEKISWTDRVRNKVLHRVKEERNIIHTVIRRKANWKDNVIRRGRKRKQLLDDLTKTTGYWELKEEALDRTVWRTGFGRDCGPAVKTEYDMSYSE